MFEILKKEMLAPQVYRMVVKAPRIAKARKPGQFVIVRHSEGGERIPLTIADANAGEGTITLIVQAVGFSTQQIVETPIGGVIQDVAGPLGKHTDIEKWGKVVCIGGGVGTAVLYPLAKALADVGNEVVTIIGGRSKPFVILADELKEFSKDVLIASDDGSVGKKGFVTDILDDFLADPNRLPNAVFAVGPLPMMAAVSERTRPHQVKTIVSLNPIMVDGTGMCGGCRVTIGSENKFACVDGPEFDGHLVDFKGLASRLETYKEHDCRVRKVIP